MFNWFSFTRFDEDNNFGQQKCDKGPHITPHDQPFKKLKQYQVNNPCSTYWHIYTHSQTLFNFLLDLSINFTNQSQFWYLRLKTLKTCVKFMNFPSQNWLSTSKLIRVSIYCVIFVLTYDAEFLTLALKMLELLLLVKNYTIFWRKYSE